MAVLENLNFYETLNMKSQRKWDWFDNLFNYGKYVKKIEPLEENQGFVIKSSKIISWNLKENKQMVVENVHFFKRKKIDLLIGSFADLFSAKILGLTETRNWAIT